MPPEASNPSGIAPNAPARAFAEGRPPPATIRAVRPNREGMPPGNAHDRLHRSGPGTARATRKPRPTDRSPDEFETRIIPRRCFPDGARTAFDRFGAVIGEPSHDSSTDRFKADAVNRALHDRPRRHTPATEEFRSIDRAECSRGKIIWKRGVRPPGGCAAEGQTT